MTPYLVTVPRQRFIYFVIRSSSFVTVSSPLQFANGSKGFIFLGTPSLSVFGTSSAGNRKVDDDFLHGEFKAPDDAAQKALTEDYVIEGIPDDVLLSGQYVQNAKISLTGGPSNSPASVIYATDGNPSGSGYLMIYPQDAAISDNSPLATALIHFMGALTPDEVNKAEGQGDAAGTDYQRYVLTNVAGMALRIELNFGTGTARFHLFGTYKWTTPPPEEGDPEGTDTGEIPIMGFERAFFVQNNP